MSVASLLAKLNELTREGKVREVTAEILRASKGGLPRDELPALADIAYRNDQIALGLRILQPMIRDAREGLAPATPEALTIYATLLQRMGAIEEAGNYLLGIKNHTPALLRLAFIHFAKWDYHRAIPLLQRYISLLEGSYEELVGRVNLLAAQIAIGDLPAAETSSRALHLKLDVFPQYKILSGNCLELDAQMALLKGDLFHAEDLLRLAALALDGQASRYLLFVNKWKAVVDLIKTPQSETARQNVLKVREDALHIRHWETVRDCDFHLSRLTHDRDLLKRVLLGTPYRSFLDRIRLVYGILPPTSRTLEFCPQKIGEKPLSIGLNLEDLPINCFLNSTSWALIQLMVKDLYRPPRIGVAFAALYPNEFFDVFHSPQRVRNSVFRFNQWTTQFNIPLKILARDGDLLLNCPPGLGVAFKARSRPLSRNQALLARFRLLSDGRSFTSDQLALAMNMTRQSALGLLRSALTSKRIAKIGRGKRTRYMFSSHRKPA